MAPTGSSTLSVRSMKSDRHHDEHAGDGADEHGDDAVDEGARRGDRDQAGQHAVDHHARVGLAEAYPHVEHRGERAGVPASIVLTATTPMRRSPPASVEPGLKPNQPNARMNVPAIAIGMSWPGIAFGAAVLV